MLSHLQSCFHSMKVIFTWDSWLSLQSNDNMEMMTQLTSEQHVSKELAARLSQQEDELKEIREQVRHVACDVTSCVTSRV